MLWRVRRWMARRLGRSLSWNPRKFGRALPPGAPEPKTRQRASAIFLGSRGLPNYAALLAWLSYEAYSISYTSGLARNACTSLELIDTCRPSNKWWLLGLLLAAELLKDAIVKMIHVLVLPCVTRSVLAPSLRWLVLHFLSMLCFALFGFESASVLLKAQLGQNETAGLS